MQSVPVSQAVGSAPDLFVPEIAREKHPTGDLLRTVTPLAAYPRALTERLAEFAARTPDRPLVAARDARGQWRTLSYAQAYKAAQSIGQALLDRGLSAERPLMILSGHSLRFAMLELAALHVGVPLAPISPAYSLSGGELERMEQLGALLTPGLVFAESGAQFERALRKLAAFGPEFLVGDDPIDRVACTRFEHLLATRPTEAVEAAFKQITADSIAKVLFTSGSTGTPKGVINTHRMLCSNQQAIRQLWPFLEYEPPVLVEWLPWHHTFAGNVEFNLALYNGGTLYIDEGSPTPSGIAATLRNLTDVAPTLYFNVPSGYQTLLPYLEQDAALRASFFKRTRLLYYAAASLPQDTWTRLDRLARDTTGRAIPMICGWGSTETAPMSTQTPRPIRFTGAIGVPAIGTEIKLCPEAGQLEARVRGPNATPGYFRQPELTAQAFDAEGFYRMGDAVRWVDAADPAQGLVFDGRLAENFKLVTGTFVHVAELRAALLEACAPLLQDVVVTGHDRAELGLLLLPSLAGCLREEAIGALAQDASLGDLAMHPELRRLLAGRIAAHNRAYPASSKRISRALMLDSPLSIDRGELTDKGAVSQRGVLRSRAHLVELLYSSADAVLHIPG